MITTIPVDPGGGGSVVGGEGSVVDGGGVVGDGDSAIPSRTIGGIKSVGQVPSHFHRQLALKPKR